MKKLILTLGLAVLTGAGADAQGTFNPLNTPLSRVKVDLDRDGIGDRNALNTDGIQVGVFIGAPGEQAEYQIGTLTIGAFEGLMVGMPTVFAPQLEGVDTSAAAQIGLRFASLNPSSWLFDSGTKIITLGAVGGPGTPVWFSAATPNRFSSLIAIVPEPSTLALGALGGLGLLFRVRNSKK